MLITLLNLCNASHGGICIGVQREAGRSRMDERRAKSGLPDDNNEFVREKSVDGILSSKRSS